MNDKVRDYILNQVTEHPTDITAIATKEFNVSRQTIVHYLNQLSDEGLVVGKGNTKARRYELKNFVKKEFYQKVDKSVEEDVLWREKILPLMDDLKPNVIDICQYGFTEIVRNVLDHSESKSFLYSITRNAICVELDVFDHGIGIFNKIQRDFNLNDPRHALLELAKGKLTSDPKGHTGEGIFFTSRMFDDFTIYSRPLFYSRESKDNSDWLLETGESDRKGTLVTMIIPPNSSRTTQSIFDAFSPDKETYGFSRTHVPIELARYDREQLVSRSQARRLLARFDRFSEVLLDFRDVNTIGQAFADEIFRVYQLEHPTTQYFAINTTNEVEKMIQRAQNRNELKPDAPNEQKQLF